MWQSALNVAGSLRQALVARRARVGGEPRVYYGRSWVPGEKDHAHGGMIKVQQLQARFPNSPALFNAVYLISSSLPPGAVRLASIAKRRGARLLWNQDGVAYPGWARDRYRAANAPLAELLRLADHVFYQSGFCRRAADEFLGTPTGSSEVLYNAVDTKRFTPNDVDPDPDRLILLLGGNQDQHYRVVSALETTACLAASGVDVRLLITGRLGWAPEPAAVREVQSRIAALGLATRVELVGRYTQARAPETLRRAHILLHTKDKDPCPGIVIEALASGLPIVYSATGGVPELVSPETGLGVPLEHTWATNRAPDPKRLAAAVLEVNRKRGEFSRAARQRAMDRFDLQPWIRRHEEVFRSLVHKRREDL